MMVLKWIFSWVVGRNKKPAEGAWSKSMFIPASARPAFVRLAPVVHRPLQSRIHTNSVLWFKCRQGLSWVHHKRSITSGLPDILMTSFWTIYGVYTERSGHHFAGWWTSHDTPSITRPVYSSPDPHDLGLQWPPHSLHPHSAATATTAGQGRENMADELSACATYCRARVWALHCGNCRLGCSVALKDAGQTRWVDWRPLQKAAPPPPLALPAK